MKKLFEYCIIYNPSEKMIKDGEEAKIVKERTSVLATTIDAVNLIAARQIPTEYDDKLDYIQIAVKAF